jgi:hypothetical protein
MRIEEGFLFNPQSEFRHRKSVGRMVDPPRLHQQLGANWVEE